MGHTFLLGRLASAGNSNGLDPTSRETSPYFRQTQRLLQKLMRSCVRERISQRLDWMQLGLIGQFPGISRQRQSPKVREGFG
jgi:hypothetical protein